LLAGQCVFRDRSADWIAAETTSPGYDNGTTSRVVLRDAQLDLGTPKAIDRFDAAACELVRGQYR
jgi:hypothetical protein